MINSKSCQFFNRTDFNYNINHLTCVNLQLEVLRFHSTRLYNSEDFLLYSFLKGYDITNCIFLKHSRQFFSLSIQNSRELLVLSFIQLLLLFLLFQSSVCRTLFYQYSHLSNKRGTHAYRFWKIPLSTKQKSPLHVYWILRFFHPPLLVY